MTKVLVLYYSRSGNTRKLAQQIARGIEAQGAEAVLRTVPELPAYPDGQVPDTTAKDPFVTRQDLLDCHGLALGSPVRFGNMAAPLKQFIDSTSGEWLSGALIDKPAAVFGAGSMLHGGQETTLLTMTVPLLHHGMVLLGVPHSERALHTTQGGGSPYGASSVAEPNLPLIADEKQIAKTLGQRLARFAQTFHHHLGQ
ncbi:NAD(P)H:quinone oxidoreductase [Salinivibrio sp. ML290]|uniref:NAD(P)H:quinone oxidoreductase n=1 Tax=Salinivibrio sp. ML290 TaxID=1909468 RepID=UPI0009888E44|nr:NAD(P)H:quinone oxidoreductase [Salinivibrio sp. ML290]OOE76836.1 NAD(P)H:quinone oxidoreductase, type IV [Salinivibrio sp. ML290]